MKSSTKEKRSSNRVDHASARGSGPPLGGFKRSEGKGKETQPVTMMLLMLACGTSARALAGRAEHWVAWVSCRPVLPGPTIYTHIHPNLLTYIHAYIHTYIHLYTYTYTYMCIEKHTHTQEHAHTHTYTCTYTSHYCVRLRLSSRHDLPTDASPRRTSLK